MQWWCVLCARVIPGSGWEKIESVASELLLRIGHAHERTKASGSAKSKSTVSKVAAAVRDAVVCILLSCRVYWWFCEVALSDWSLLHAQQTHAAVAQENRSVANEQNRKRWCGARWCELLALKRSRPKGHDPHLLLFLLHFVNSFSTPSSSRLVRLVSFVSHIIYILYIHLYWTLEYHPGQQ